MNSIMKALIYTTHRVSMTEQFFMHVRLCQEGHHKELPLSQAYSWRAIDIPIQVHSAVIE